MEKKKIVQKKIVQKKNSTKNTIFLKIVYTIVQNTLTTLFRAK